MPGTILDSGDAAVSKPDKNPYPCEPDILVWEADNKQSN